MTADPVRDRSDGAGSWIAVEAAVRLFVQDWGRGKPIVLVAGYPYSHLTWDYNAPALVESGFRVVAPDLRGFGLSDKPYDGNDYETWAADLAAVLDALDLEDVTLVGHCLGAGVCLQLVGGRGEPRVNRLALLAGPVPHLGANRRGAEAIDRWIRLLRTDRPAFLDLFGSLVFFNPSPQFTAWSAADGLQASSRACVRGLEELRDRDLTGQARNVRVPTRLLWGTHDNIVTRSLVDAQLTLIEGSELVELETSGHGLHYDRWAELNRALVAFASGTAPDGGPP